MGQGHDHHQCADAHDDWRQYGIPQRLRIAAFRIEPGRASVIVAGVIVLREVLTAYGLSEIEVSERDVLHGAAFAAAELPEPEEGAAPPGAYTCC